jgi:glycosyltransferase involved in cell wall biosynthesis
VVAPSKYLGEKMERYRPDLRLMPNAIELSAYPFRLRHSPYPHLVWLRSFHKLYNPFLAIRAIKYLRRDFADVQLTMVGNDKGDGSLEEGRKLAYDLGIADHIKFPGRAEKSQVPRWLSRGDIFLNTSDVDNTPVSVIEAMACGLCIVSTRVGGVPYLLDHGTNALLIEPGDAEGLAAAVRRIICEPGLASQLSNGARRKAENFDWRVILPKWEGLFSSLNPLYSQQVVVRSGR